MGSKPRNRISRRRFLRALGVLSGGILLSHAESGNGNPLQKKWLMPDESAPHKRTWMAFGASQQIWGRRLLPVVRQNLALVARTIVKYEPVSMLVRSQERSLVRKMVGPQVKLIDCPMDDLWIRDTGPVFVVNAAGQKAAVDFNFNGWGAKQRHDRDQKVARFVTHQAGVPAIASDLVLEGGAIEVDGRGTAIITESCILNPNRNPGMTQQACEKHLKNLLGLEKIIWLPGIAGKDITDGHTDFYARFARPGVVVVALDLDPASFDYPVTRRHLEILSAAKDAAGRRLEVIPIPAPQDPRGINWGEDFAAGYINFYLCKGAVIVPEFGDPDADRRARQTLADLFPERDVVQINIDGIAAGGGGIHCATQQEPVGMNAQNAVG